MTNQPTESSAASLEPVERFRDTARKVLKMEAEAILNLIPRLDESFDRAVELLAGCQGRVVTTGMGKSGIVCRKLAATLASSGTPSLFLHPAEAVHGDLGMVAPGDVVLALSNSGETAWM
jgi:arabinose-5-phosphate isomerase